MRMLGHVGTLPVVLFRWRSLAPPKVRYRLLMHEPAGSHDRDNRILPALLRACPSFAPRWQEHINDYSDKEGRLLYVALGALATHLVARLEEDRTEEFRSVFGAVERLWRDGDGGVRYALKVGLLEALGNIAANRMGWQFAARFRAWFGPHATVAWDDLHAEWGTSDGRLDIGARGPTEGPDRPIQDPVDE